MWVLECWGERGVMIGNCEDVEGMAFQCVCIVAYVVC